MQAWQRNALTWHGNGTLKEMSVTLPALYQLDRSIGHHGDVREGVCTVGYPMSESQKWCSDLERVRAAPSAAVTMCANASHWQPSIRS